MRKRIPRFSAYHDMARELTRDFFAQHYPGADLTYVGEHYEEMRRATGEMIALIREHLPQHFAGLP